MEIPRMEYITMDYHKQLQTHNGLEKNAYSYGPYGNLFWIPAWIRDNSMNCHAIIITCLKLAYKHCGIPYANLSNFNGYLVDLNK
jgi:hypothetical protein